MAMRSPWILVKAYRPFSTRSGLLLWAVLSCDIICFVCFVCVPTFGMHTSDFFNHFFNTLVVTASRTQLPGRWGRNDHSIVDANNDDAGLLGVSTQHRVRHNDTRRHRRTCCRSRVVEAEALGDVGHSLIR